MKKRLLFIIPSLSSGGGERSLVNLLNHLDYSAYEVDLFLLSREGLFERYLPAEVNVLPLPEPYRLFSLPLLRSLARLAARGRIRLACNRLLYSVRHRFRRNAAVREQYNWKYLSAALPRFGGRYDAAIGYLEKTSTYICVDKADAGKKIGWIHIDYDKMGMDAAFDRDYFRRLDRIVTVSEECAAVLHNRFPEFRPKIGVIYNIVSPALIRRLADEDVSEGPAKQAGEVVIVSIGRLHPQKNFELAVEACRELVERGHNVRWNVIGEGDERERLTRLIAANGLADRFRLLGLRANPYPYLRQADIYVQTSRYEGKSIAIDEAKIMGKPIVVTNFSTAKDQIRDGCEGLVVEMNARAVAAGVERLIVDERLRLELCRNLSALRLGTEQEIEKLYRLLDG